MSWIKRGLIFNANKNSKWMYRGALIPTPVLINEKIVRVFLTFCDSNGIGRPGYVDLDINNLKNVLAISNHPLFDVGIPGTFDENGCLTCSVIKNQNSSFSFYYAGFELGTKIRYRLLTGLTITDKNFNLIHKYNTPILERSERELYFRCGPFCIFDHDKYRLWYVGGSNWIELDGKQMPVYEIKYIESEDGLHWPTEGKTCIEITSDLEHGFGRPYVIKHNGIYKMFYSIRVKNKGYRLGYAESYDGIDWIRMDDQMKNLDVSDTGWDSEMICYSSVIELNGRLVMFYNGNNYGATGFGYAEYV